MSEWLKDRIAEVMGYVKRIETHTIPHGSQKGDIVGMYVYYNGDRVVDDIDFNSWNLIAEAANRIGLPCLPTNKDEAMLALQIQFIMNEAEHE